MNRRRKDLAIIHIAKKSLGMDDDTYRQMLFTIARVRSAADLNHTGRIAVIEHLHALGFKSPRPITNSRRHYKRGTTKPQVGLMLHLWHCLARAGAVDAPGRHGLRTWVKAASRKYHPHDVGYDAPELLPNDVTNKLIEMLKGMADDRDINWREGAWAYE